MHSLQIIIDNKQIYKPSNEDQEKNYPFAKSCDKLEFNKTQIKPQFKFQHLPHEYFSILAVDPDAPSRSDPINKYWLHWLVINNDKEVVEYHPPSPPPGSGYHRYVFFLLKQRNNLDEKKLGLLENTDRAASDKYIRKQFNAAEFIFRNNMDIVDFVCFETKR